MLSNFFPKKDKDNHPIKVIIKIQKLKFQDQEYYKVNNDLGLISFGNIFDEIDINNKVKYIVIPIGINNNNSCYKIISKFAKNTSFFFFF